MRAPLCLHRPMCITTGSNQWARVRLNVGNCRHGGVAGVLETLKSPTPSPAVALRNCRACRGHAPPPQLCHLKLCLRLCLRFTWRKGGYWTSTRFCWSVGLSLVSKCLEPKSF